MYRSSFFLAMAAPFVAGLVGLVAWRMGASPIQMLLFTFSAAAAVGGLVAARELRRARWLSRLADGAELLLAQERPATQSPTMQDELNRLEAVMKALSRQMTAQTKEHAKKSRNLEALIDSLDEPVLVTDNADDVLLCNPAAERVLGVPRGKLPGRNVRELFTSERLLAMHAAARAGRTERGEARLVSATGPRVFQVSAAPLPPAWGEGIFGVVMALRDVTELAQAAAMRTEFVANASHELRTPVAAIRAAIETLEDGGSDDPAMRTKLFRMIESHSRRLEDMTRDLMELSRLEDAELAVRPAPVDWAELEAVLRETFDAAIKARSLELRFEVDPAATAPAVQSDGKLLLLILRNLVDNAAKYSHEGTTINVRVHVRPSAAGTPTLRLEVKDRGIGIPLEHQERVFERFFQVDPARTGTGSSARRGTGLGLSIVKHAAKALGGRAGLESVWGKGTTVWVEVPASPPT